MEWLGYVPFALGIADGWIYAIMAAGMGAQAIGAYLGGSGENRKQFRTKDNVAMGDAIAEFTETAIEGMLNDARTRGYASTAPRVKFGIPTGRTKTAPGVLPWSGQNYRFGGSSLGTFSGTQGQYAGLGGGQKRTALNSLESYYMKAKDPEVPPQEPETITGDDGVRVTISEQWPDGRGRGRGDDENYEDPWGRYGEGDHPYSTRPGGGPPPKDGPVGWGKNTGTSSAGYTQGAPPRLAAAASPSETGTPTVDPQHQGSGGQYGQKYEQVKALRDNVASRGSLARNGGGRQV
jgi:hypothetical protein